MIGIAVLAAACSDASGQGAVPQGWQRVEGDGWSFAVPDEFRNSDPMIDERRTAELVGVEELGPGQPAELVGLSTPADEREIDVDGYIALVLGADAVVDQLEDYEVVAQEAIDVPGATEAQRLRTRYTETALDGAPSVVQSVVVARDDAGTIWDLRYAAVDTVFEDGIADGVAASLALGR